MKLTPKQAADQAKVSVGLIYAWVADGRLAHYRVRREGRRGRILIDYADLEQVIAGCRQECHPPSGSGKEPEALIKYDTILALDPGRCKGVASADRGTEPRDRASILTR